MSSTLPRGLLRIAYEEAAEAYLRSLPPEHFMESVRQSGQRKVTDASMDQIHAIEPEIQCFGELLLQFGSLVDRRPRQVVPDNMVFRWKEPLEAEGSYSLPFQPVKPFFVLEYVSKSTKRKDYEDSFQKYETELKIPYYLIFYPDDEELTLYRHNRRRYVTVLPNESERYPIPDLELEVGLVDGWVRYWFRGELVPLPAELKLELEEMRRKLRETERKLLEETQLRQEEQRLRQEEQRKLREANARIDDLQRRADEAEEQRRRAAEAENRLQREREATLALQQELEQLRSRKRRRGTNGSAST